MNKLTLLLAMPLAALAHPGHGLFGAHWHATDVWGFAALLAVFAAATWWTRRK